MLTYFIFFLTIVLKYALCVYVSEHFKNCTSCKVAGWCQSSTVHLFLKCLTTNSKTDIVVLVFFIIYVLLCFHRKTDLPQYK